MSNETAETDKRGARGSGRTKLYLPTQILIPELDGPIVGLSPEEEKRIATLEPWEQAKELAPYRVRGILAHFAGNEHACAMIESQLDDRSVQMIDPGFHASCESGVHEPVILSDVGNLPNGEPALLIIEGRQRVRSLRLWNHERSKADPPSPPLSLNCIVRTFASPKKAREVRVITGCHVPLSILQKAARAQEFLDAGVAAVDVAPIVGLTSGKAVKDLVAVLRRPDEIKEAIDAGNVSATALRELRHLSAGEQKARVEAVVQTGAKGRKARAILRTGSADAVVTKAPARSIIDSLGKRLTGSSDPLLAVCGALLVWVQTGKDPGGLARAPGLRELVQEEVERYHGAALSDAEKAKLAAWCEGHGSPAAAAEKAGINPASLAKALAGMRVKSRVRAALLRVIAQAETKP